MANRVFGPYTCIVAASDLNYNACYTWTPKITSNNIMILAYTNTASYAFPYYFFCFDQKTFKIKLINSLRTNDADWHHATLEIEVCTDGISTNGWINEQ